MTENIAALQAALLRLTFEEMMDASQSISDSLSGEIEVDPQNLSLALNNFAKNYGKES